jgi:hypothetical protein
VTDHVAQRALSGPDKCGCQYVVRSGVRVCLLEPEHPGVHTDGVWKWHITSAPGPFAPMPEPESSPEVERLRESLALRDAAYDHQIGLTEMEMRNRDRYKQALLEIRRYPEGWKDRGSIQEFIDEVLKG